MYETIFSYHIHHLEANRTVTNRLGYVITTGIRYQTKRSSAVAAKGDARQLAAPYLTPARSDAAVRWRHTIAAAGQCSFDPVVVWELE